jgi:predicted nucleic acid-binding protein
METNVVLDTNVVFAGLTDRASDAGRVVDLFLDQQPDLTLCVCDALTYEYEDLFGRRLSPRRIPDALGLLSRLLVNARYIHIDIDYRPIARDPGDDHVANCAINADAVLVTFNVRDFVPAVQTLGLITMTPGQFLTYLRREGML